MTDSIHADAIDTVRISARRFEPSPFFDCYRAEETVLGVYAGRFHAVYNGEDATVAYWALRRRAALFDVPERPVEIAGPDAAAFLEHIFSRRVADLKGGRGRYAIACTPAGGIFMDGILFRLAGNPEYNQARVPSYAAAVDAYFADFRDHPAVRLARVRWRGMLPEHTVAQPLDVPPPHAPQPRAAADTSPAGQQQPAGRRSSDAQHASGSSSGECGVDRACHADPSITTLSQSDFLSKFARDNTNKHSTANMFG